MLSLIAKHVYRFVDIFECLQKNNMKSINMFASKEDMLNVVMIYISIVDIRNIIGEFLETFDPKKYEFHQSQSSATSYSFARSGVDFYRFFDLPDEQIYDRLHTSMDICRQINFTLYEQTRYYPPNEQNNNQYMIWHNTFRCNLPYVFRKLYLNQEMQSSYVYWCIDHEDTDENRYINKIEITIAINDIERIKNISTCDQLCEYLYELFINSDKQYNERYFIGRNNNKKYRQNQLWQIWNRILKSAVIYYINYHMTHYKWDDNTIID